jgi:hypothetical protein
MAYYTGAPYFVAPTLWNRWGFGAWWWWILGLPLPGDKENDGDKYQSHGYCIPQLGPDRGIEVQKQEENAVKAIAALRSWHSS